MGPRSCWPAWPVLLLAWTGASSWTLHPHQATAWTEGLACDRRRGLIFESAGLLGHSGVRGYARNGLTKYSFRLGDDRFGESLALDPASRTVWQTTFQDAEVVQLSEDLQLLRRLPIPGAVVGVSSLRSLEAPGRVSLGGSGLSAEDTQLAADLFGAMGEAADAEVNVAPVAATGSISQAWGLAFDSARGEFLLSDGTTQLHRISRNFSERVGVLPVTFPKGFELSCRGPDESGQLPTPELQLNELEYVPGSALGLAATHALRHALPSGNCGAEPPIDAACAADEGSNADAEVWAAVPDCTDVLRIRACSGEAVGWLRFEDRGRAAPAGSASVLVEADSRRARHSSRKRAQPAMVLEAGGADVPDTASCGPWQPEELSSVIATEGRRFGHLNGLALCDAGEDDPAAQPTFLVTGKNWRHLVEASLSEVLVAGGLSYCELQRMARIG